MLDGLAQLLKMIDNFGRSFSREQDVELLSSTTVSLSSASHTPQTARNQTQYLIAGIVSVSVVEALEVVDIHDCDRVRRLQPQERIIEGAPRRQGRKFIVISQKVRVLDNRSPKNAGGSHRVCNGNARRSRGSQG